MPAVTVIDDDRDEPWLVFSFMRLSPSSASDPATGTSNYTRALAGPGRVSDSVPALRGSCVLLSKGDMISLIRLPCLLEMPLL